MTIKETIQKITKITNERQHIGVLWKANKKTGFILKGKLKEKNVKIDIAGNLFIDGVKDDLIVAQLDLVKNHKWQKSSPDFLVYMKEV